MLSHTTDSEKVTAKSKRKASQAQSSDEEDQEGTTLAGEDDTNTNTNSHSQSRTNDGDGDGENDTTLAESDSSGSDSDTDTNTGTLEDTVDGSDNWTMDESKSKGSASASASNKTFELSDQHERQLWKDWDKYDDDDDDHNDDVPFDEINAVHYDEAASQLTRFTELELQQRRSQHVERRARAHEKLLLAAYAAQSVPQSTLKEKAKTITTKNSTIHNNTNHTLLEEDHPPDALNKDSMSLTYEPQEDEEEEEEVSPPQQERLSPLSKHSQSHSQSHSHSHSPPTNQFRYGQLEKERAVFHTFCAVLKNKGVQVLKLNRDRKWQIRFLTVSKEVTFLTSDTSTTTTTDQELALAGDPLSHPQGFLWVKKFSHKTQYSIATIDKQGKGGIFMTNLQGVGYNDHTVDATLPSLSKKQRDKFNDSVSLTIHGSHPSAGPVQPREIVIRCLCPEDAEFLVSGIHAVVTMLHPQQI